MPSTPVQQYSLGAQSSSSWQGWRPHSNLRPLLNRLEEDRGPRFRAQPAQLQVGREEALHPPLLRLDPLDGDAQHRPGLLGDRFSGLQPGLEVA